jgi:hypothetical protein
MQRNFTEVQVFHIYPANIAKFWYRVNMRTVYDMVGVEIMKLVISNLDSLVGTYKVRRHEKHP